MTSSVVCRAIVVQVGFLLGGSVLLFGCLRGESDMVGRVLDGRPDAYDEGSGLAPVPGGLNANNGDPSAAQPGSFGPVANANVVDFTPQSAFSAAIDANAGGTVVYALEQPQMCSDFLLAGKATAPSLLQVLLPRGAPIGTYNVGVADAASSSVAPPANQAVLSLIASGTVLLSGAQGTLQVSSSSNGTLRISALSVTFGGGQTLTVDSIDAVPCSATVAAGAFASGAAYVRPATGATSMQGALPPTLTLIDRPLSCAALRDPNTVPPADANMLYLVLPAATAAPFAVVNTNVGNNSVQNANASVRLSQPANALIANTGQVKMTAVSGQWRGSVQATFNDGSMLSATPFVATECP